MGAVFSASKRKFRCLNLYLPVVICDLVNLYDEKTALQYCLLRAPFPPLLIYDLPELNLNLDVLKCDQRTLKYFPTYRWLITLLYRHFQGRVCSLLRIHLPIIDLNQKKTGAIWKQCQRAHQICIQPSTLLHASWTLEPSNRMVIEETQFKPIFFALHGGEALLPWLHVDISALDTTIDVTFSPIYRYRQDYQPLFPELGIV